MKTTFANDPDSVTWLRDTHLSARNAEGEIPPFASFVLAGNEDYPDKLTLYASADPLVTDTPVAVFVPGPDDGIYRRA